MAKTGDWVTIQCTILTPDERAPQVPEDTAKTPLCQWVKGRLLADANMGDTATVKTRTGRKVEGKVVEINPAYQHSFGAYIPQLQQVQDSIKNAMWGKES